MMRGKSLLFGFVEEERFLGISSQSVVLSCLVWVSLAAWGFIPNSFYKLRSRLTDPLISFDTLDEKEGRNFVESEML
jgi:hypothetical protein